MFITLLLHLNNIMDKTIINKTAISNNMEMLYRDKMFWPHHQALIYLCTLNEDKMLEITHYLQCGTVSPVGQHSQLVFSLRLNLGQFLLREEQEGAISWR